MEIPEVDLEDDPSLASANTPTDEETEELEQEAEQELEAEQVIQSECDGAEGRGSGVRALWC